MAALPAWMRELGPGLLHIVFPRRCLLCHAALAWSSDAFCVTCMHALQPDASLPCPRCALPIGPYSFLEGGCGACRDDSLPWTHAFRLGQYDGRLRASVLRLKHQQGHMLGAVIGGLWARLQRGALLSTNPDIIVPVPLHWTRRMLRGYNQSECLAHAMAKELALPCYPHLLKRTRATPKQTGLSATARKENVRSAFRARADRTLKNRSILLIDDVMTTGATLGVAGRALLDAGASRITVAVLARACSTSNVSVTSHLTF